MIELKTSGCRLGMSSCSDTLNALRNIDAFT